MLADQPLTLSAGSMARYPFPDVVRAAADAGFAAISVTKRLRYLAHHRSGLTDRRMRETVRAHGLRVAEVEGTPGWLRAPAPPDPHVLELDEALALASTLGASSVVAYHDGRPRPPDAAAEDFARACDRAAEHGLTLALEFLPWSPVPTLEAAAGIVEGAGRPNGRVVLDTWHLAHGPLAELSLSPTRAALISCVQLADARPPRGDDLVQETMYGRRTPGTGTIDLRRLVSTLDEAGVACPVAVEVYDETMADLDARAYATILASSARDVLRPCG